MGMCAAASDLMRRAHDSQPELHLIGNIVYHSTTGFPTIRLGSGPITMAMVREIQDDE